MPKINVNGVEIESDKKVASIVGNEVHFQDGSFCDVSSGTIVNVGPGYVKLSSSSEKTFKRADREGRFISNSLIVQDLKGNIEISSHESNEILVLITGPEDQIDNIILKKKEGAVFIGGLSRKPSSRRGLTFSNINQSVTCGGNVNGSVIITGDGFSAVRAGDCSIVQSVGGSCVTQGVNVSSILGKIKGLSSRHVCSVKIVVKVPREAIISLKGIDGRITIGDNSGELKIDME